MSVCVFTPTYQRAYLLPRLYESLLAQTSRAFTWLVVDDGSTDGTDELVHGWQAEGALAIDYVRTENGGKQRAWNVGAARAVNELFFCVDSDDALLPGAIERIEGVWAERGTKQAVGLAGLFGRMDAPAEPLRKPFPAGVSSTGLWDLYTEHGFKGDLALVYRTELMRAYPYAVDPREKFVSEYTVSYALDAEGPLLLDNTIYGLREYLGDGYTAHVRKLTANNPAGYARFHRQCVDLSRRPYDRWYHETLYLVGCALAEERYGAFDGGPSQLPAGPERPLAWLGARLLLPTAFRER